MKRLDGKIAIITGGGSGIGRGLALALAEEGARVVVCGRRASKLDETVQAVGKQGGEALAIQANIAVEQDVDRVVSTTLQKYGQIDILINNAGVYAGAEVHRLEPATWDEIMAINLRGPYLVTRAVIPHMRLRRSGQIVNISSESGIGYEDGDGAYGTSKHALNAFAEYVQRENQEYNIRVNSICPGMVVTEMTENDEGLNHDRCLYPEDIADLAIWLLTRRENIKIGAPVLIQTMLNPWEKG
jgi:3-oxoacyl-[acyl-carrier protein] reductase